MVSVQCFRSLGLKRVHFMLNQIYNNIGHFQCKGDVTLPLLKCCLLVLRGPVECGQLEYELSCHCAGNRLKSNGLERNSHMK